MVYGYLKRGVFAGGVAGAAYGLFLLLVANPLTEYLHAAEQRHSHDHSHSAADSAELVAESTTAIVSVGGGLLWAIFLGGVFALALFVFEPAIPGSKAVKPYVLAGVGFLTVSVTPWLVLPPATPGAEQLYGVDARLAIYGGLVVLGAALSVSALGLYHKTASKQPVVGIIAGGAPIVGTIMILPAVTPTVVTHPGLSTDLVAAYQGLVVVGQAGLWFLVAATFGWLQQRESSPTVPRSADPASTESV